MTAPSTYLRELRDAQATRRLELAKLLRDDPKATNVALAKALGVNRDTIAEDRKAIMEEIKKNTLDETAFYRLKLLNKLEALLEVLETRRADKGKFSLQSVDREITLIKEIKDLMGVRKPVVEKFEMKRPPIAFNTVIVRTNGEVSEPKKYELLREPRTLEAGDEH